VFVRIDGELKYLWRAVGTGGNVLDLLVRAAGAGPPPGVSSAPDEKDVYPAAT
jgi:hypothetical protein